MIEVSMNDTAKGYATLYEHRYKLPYLADDAISNLIHWNILDPSCRYDYNLNGRLSQIESSIANIPRQNDVSRKEYEEAKKGCRNDIIASITLLAIGVGLIYLGVSLLSIARIPELTAIPLTIGSVSSLIGVLIFFSPTTLKENRHRLNTQKLPFYAYLIPNIYTLIHFKPFVPRKFDPAKIELGSKAYFLQSAKQFAELPVLDTNYKETLSNKRKALNLHLLTKQEADKAASPYLQAERAMDQILAFQKTFQFV